MSLYDYEVGTQFSGTGTAESSAASTTVTGTGASFDTEFAAGYLIIVAGETRVVDSIANANSLEATVAFTTGSGGAVAFSGVNLQNVEDLVSGSDELNELAPKSTFAAYSEMVALGNGNMRGAGFAAAAWRFGWLSRSQRDQFRTLCTGASNDVYVRTRENDSSDAYTYYSGVMVWPIGQEEKDHGIRLDFTLKFKSLTEVSVS